MRIRKEIVKAGRYLIPDADGKETLPDGTKATWHEITPERMQKWVANFHAMKAAGIHVPAPWSHVQEVEKEVRSPNGRKRKQLVKQLVQPVVVGPGGTLSSSADNAGFWEDLAYDAVNKVLVGDVEAPGDVDDPNTPAGKLGTTVKETSIHVVPKWTDGKGRTWDEAPLHIACVTHGIEPGQSNFVPVSEGLSLAMSFYQDEEGLDAEEPDGDEELGLEEDPLQASGDYTAQAMQLLADSVNIVLPGDTNELNFMERLVIALTQYAACNEDEEDEGSITQPPEGANQKAAPFIMSFTDKQRTALLKTVNPETGKNFTADELSALSPVAPAAPAVPEISEAVLMSHPVVQKLVGGMAGLQDAYNGQAKANYAKRIEALKKRGAKAEFITQLETLNQGLTMSFANGQPVKQEIDYKLEAAEAMAAPFAAAAPDFSAGFAMSHGTDTVVLGADQMPYSIHGQASDAPANTDSVEASFKRLQASGLFM